MDKFMDNTGAADMEHVTKTEFHTAEYTIQFEIDYPVIINNNYNSALLIITVIDAFGQIVMKFSMPNYKAFELYDNLYKMEAIYEPGSNDLVTRTVEIPPQQNMRYSVITQMSTSGTQVLFMFLETDMVNKNRHKCISVNISIDCFEYINLFELLQVNFANMPIDVMKFNNAWYYYEHMDEFI